MSASETGRESAANPTPRGSGRPEAESAVNRLLCVDALRAVAALMVAFSHAPSVGGVLAPLRPLQVVGHTGVGLFLVLSGFSIHYAWAARTDLRMFDSRRFWRRRIVRLYPAYVGAVVLEIFVLLVVLSGDFELPDWRWGGGQTTLFAAIASQVALISANLVPTAFVGISWTLGLELQLYALYNGLVRHIRRIGIIRLVVALFMVSVTWRIASQFVTASHPVGQFFADGTSSELGRLFGAQVPARAFEWFLGVLAAEAYFGRVRVPNVTRSWWAGLIALVAAGFILRVQLGEAEIAGNPFYVSDLVLDALFGVGYFCVLRAMIHRESTPTRRAPLAVRLLAPLGIFSYSLYLVHAPAIALGERAFGERSGDFAPLFLVAFAVVVAYGFFLVVERRFLSVGTHVKGRTTVR